MKGLGKKLSIYAMSFLVLVGILLIWHLYVTIWNVPEYLLPGPIGVAEQFVAMVKDGTLLYHAGVTSAGIAAGFAIGSVLGFFCGYLLSKSRAMENALYPYIMVIQATPKVSLIPLFVIWFGLGMGPKLLLIVLSVFFPVMANTITGFRSTPRDYYDLMTILGASSRQTLYKVKVPLSLPIIMAGLKIAMVQAVIGAIVAEWVSGKDGLGYLLVYGSTLYNSRMLIASILATTVLGVVFYMVIDFIEAKVLFWHESQNIVKEGAL
ncbi:ABC transporter permease [Breznakiella homolactica]|uniref:ABC transporter permease n=1 Tax=Breznakiella homolactica TaxID=2798577 RepID=A0A7T7XQD4_9SPIR|nr:ABC transporter permease [Breznakiella homolactica]QQO10556.1 ABC transporter permease [Breznakiella homolactica]